MYEPFDRGDRPGPYLEPILVSDGVPRGGRVAVVGAGGCPGLMDGVDRALRAAARPAVFTPPVFAGDALSAADPAFGLCALREFVEICLGQLATSQR